MVDFLDQSLADLDAAELRWAGSFQDLLISGSDEILESLRSGRGEISAPFSQRVYELINSLYLDVVERVIPLMSEFLEELKNDENTALRIVSDYTNELPRDTARSVLQTTLTQIRAMVNGGLATGQSADDAFGAVIDKIPRLAQARAAVITRTEAHSLGQFAAYSLAVRSQIPMIKRWNTTKDEFTRDFGFSGKVSEFNHRVMDGEEMPLLGSFQVPRRDGSFELLRFPGDPAGSAGNVINCRCILTFRRA